MRQGRERVNTGSVHELGEWGSVPRGTPERRHRVHLRVIPPEGRGSWGTYPTMPVSPLEGHFREMPLAVAWEGHR